MIKIHYINNIPFKKLIFSLVVFFIIIFPNHFVSAAYSCPTHTYEVGVGKTYSTITDAMTALKAACPSPTAAGGVGGPFGGTQTVLVYNGTYSGVGDTTYAPIWNNYLAPTASAPLIVEAAPGNSPVINCGGGTNDNFLIYSPYVTFTGFEVTNCRKAVLVSTGTGYDGHNATIYNNYIHDSASSAFYTIDASSASNAYIHHNYLKNISMGINSGAEVSYNEVNTTTANNNIQSAIGGYVHDNIVYNGYINTASGIQALNNAIISNNISYSNRYGIQGQITTAPGPTFTGNIVVGNMWSCHYECASSSCFGNMSHNFCYKSSNGANLGQVMRINAAGTGSVAFEKYNISWPNITTNSFDRNLYSSIQAAGSMSDYNDFWRTGTVGTPGIVAIGSTNYLDLTSWKTNPAGWDAHTFETNPNIKGDPDLLVTYSQVCPAPTCNTIEERLAYIRNNYTPTNPLLKAHNLVTTPGVREYLDIPDGIDIGAVPVADVTPPTVSITSPSPSTVSGSISLTANSADNFDIVSETSGGPSDGVQGVKFYHDDPAVPANQIGTEVTTASPAGTYTLPSWNSATISNGSHTLFAVSRDLAGNTATSSSVAVTISNTSPPSLLTSPATATATSTATINGSITSNGGADATQSGFVYGTDPALATGNATSTLGPKTGNASLSQNLTSLAPNTIYYFKSYATNSAGTGYGNILSFNTNDVTPPSVSLTAPSGGTTVSGSSVTLTATATDDVGVVGIQFKLDGTTNINSEVTSTTSPKTYTTTWNSTGITIYGSHTIYAVGRDAGGNYATSTVSINVDNVAPTMQSATHDSDTQITVTLSKLANATTIIKANAGGFTVTKTGTGTTYAISSITPGSDNTKVVLTVANMSLAGGAGVTVTYTAGGNGTVADTLGNLLATNSTGIVIPPWNTVNPIISNITSTKPDGFYNAGTNIEIDLTFSKTVNTTGNITVTLNTGGTCSFSGISNASTASCIYTVQAGENIARLNVTSVAGTIADTVGNPMVSFAPATNLSVNKNIMIDTTNPIISIDAPTTGSTVSGTAVTLTADASDTGSGIAGIQFKLDTNTLIGSESATSPYSISWNSTSVSDGTHTFIAVARGRAGNQATSSAVNVTVDNTAPTRLSGSPTGALASSTTSTTIQLSTGENATCKYSTSPNTSYDSMTTFDTTGGTTHSASISGLASGTSYSYYVKCRDTFGNTNADDYTISFSVASPTVTPPVTPPTTPSITPSNGPVISSGTNISLPNQAKPRPQIIYPDGRVVYLDSSTAERNSQTGTSSGLSNQTNSSSSHTFAKNLKLGQTHTDVKLLQQFLNTHGFIIATLGPGSPDNETNVFGPLTYKALKAFQKSVSLPSTGWFGVMTREYIKNNF